MLASPESAAIYSEELHTWLHLLIYTAPGVAQTIRHTQRFASPVGNPYRPLWVASPAALPLDRSFSIICSKNAIVFLNRSAGAASEQSIKRLIRSLAIGSWPSRRWDRAT